MKPFLLFLFYTLITCVYSFMLCVMEFIRCGILDIDDSCEARSEMNRFLKGFNKSVAIVGEIVNLVIAICALAVLVTQLRRIKVNLGVVDKLKIYDQPQKFQMQ